MLTVPVLSLANARETNPMAGVDTVAAFINQLIAVPWFALWGQPSEWDQGAVRLRQWSEWPGPDDADVLALALENQSIYDEGEAQAVRLGRGEDFTRAFQQLHDLAHAHARDSGVSFDRDEDAWHGPSQSVWDAAFCTALVGCFIELGWNVPEDLQEQWAWYKRGHWPCGFAPAANAGLRMFRVL